jgi:hypothetical protein
VVERSLAHLDSCIISAFAGYVEEVAAEESLLCLSVVFEYSFSLLSKSTRRLLKKNKDSLFFY